MTVYYIDYEGGNDANAGTSFATRWKTLTNGATAARLNGGDEVRLMASPDPTSIGSATWTGSYRKAAVTVSSSTNASPIVITTAADHGLTAGMYVNIAGHVTNTNANGVWKVGTVPNSTSFQILKIDGTNTTGNGVGSGGTSTDVTNCMVKLPTPITKNVALCGGLAEKPVWTASANVTTTQDTASYKEGYSSASIAILTAFTTGKAAYYALPSTLDLSAYQQISFWVRMTGTATAGNISLVLCTDTLGAVAAHTCTIPSLGAASQWVPVTVNFGANMSSLINSIALYVNSDVGAQTVLIDNIVACKNASSADSLNLASLISKNTGTEPWHPIESINYDTIMLGNINAGNPTSSRGYSGATETVTTYKRETIKINPAISSSTPVNTVNDGSLASTISFSGGWNRTDMSTQTGETWFDGQNGYGYGFSNAFANTTFDKINATRYNIGYRHAPATGVTGGRVISGQFIGCTTGIQAVSGTYGRFDSIWVNCNSTGFLDSSATGLMIDTINDASGNLSTGFGFSSGSLSIRIFAKCDNNGTYGVNANSSNAGVIGSLSANNNTYGLYFTSAGEISINAGSTSGNSFPIYTGAGKIFLNDFSISEAVEVTYANAINYSYGGVFSTRHDGIAKNAWIFYGRGTVNQQSSVIDGEATTAWKMSPTDSQYCYYVPLKLKIGTVVCNAGSLVTITARMRRDNTGLTMRLLCPAGAMTGSATDVYADAAASADTWETVTISFTPTASGAVEVYAYAIGNGYTSYSGFVCNMTATQA